MKGAISGAAAAKIATHRRKSKTELV